jgi:VanZ family protein
MSPLDRLIYSNRRALRAGTWFYVILLAYLSLIPSDLEARTGVPGELEHIVAYLVAAVLFAVSYPQKGFLIATALVAHAGLLEALQFLSPGRTASLLDACASGSGAISGVVAVSFFTRADSI